MRPILRRSGGLGRRSPRLRKQRQLRGILLCLFLNHAVTDERNSQFDPRWLHRIHLMNGRSCHGNSLLQGPPTSEAAVASLHQPFLFTRRSSRPQKKMKTKKRRDVDAPASSCCHLPPSYWFTTNETEDSSSRVPN